MANQIITDTIGTTGKFSEGSFEYPIEQDFLLADYDKPVFKIIKTTADHTITQKYINGNKLIVEGFFRITLWYQPPGGEKLTVISKKIPFRKTVDFSVQVQPPFFINVSGQCQYVNARAVSPTRVDVRGVYSFTITGYSRQRQEVATAVNSSTACRDSSEIPHFCLSSQGIRQFSAEDELSLPQMPEKILHTTVTNNNMTVTVYNDKVNVKGEISADIAYMAEGIDELHRITKIFPYNQIVDTAGAIESNTAYVDFSFIGLTITQNPETKNINCIATAQLDVKVFRKMSVIIASDAFSKKYRYIKEKTEAVCDSNIRSVYKNIPVTVEDSVPRGYIPVYAFARTTPPWIATGDGHTAVMTRVNISVIVKNTAGEYDCMSKTEDIQVLQDSGLKPEYEYILCAESGVCAVSLSGETLSVRVPVAVSGFVICRSAVETLQNFEENSDKENISENKGLVLYYGTKGEKLFDIAQRYSTDTAVIMEENGVDGKILAEDRMLFIPVFGM